MTNKAYTPKVGDQVFVAGQRTKRYVIALAIETKKTVVLQENTEDPKVLYKNVPLWAKDLRPESCKRRPKIKIN